MLDIFSDVVKSKTSNLPPYRPIPDPIPKPKRKSEWPMPDPIPKPEIELEWPTPEDIKNIAGRERISILDNVFRDKVKPTLGSVVICDLYAFDHSGIYVGNGNIAHRSGDGYIEIVGPEEFMNRLEGYNNAISIYVSCKDKNAIGWRKAAERAKAAAYDCTHDQHSGYDLLNRNCHHFTRWCLTGDSDQWGFDFTFFSLEDLLMTKYGMNNWRVWDL